MNKKFLLIPALFTLLTACNPNSPPSLADQSSDMTSDQADTDNMITQNINDWLTSDNSLSTNAQNIQVMTSNGVVTLDGKVASVQEKNKVINKVKNMQGVNSVNDNLSIATGY